MHTKRFLAVISIPLLSCLLFGSLIFEVYKIYHFHEVKENIISHLSDNQLVKLKSIKKIQKKEIIIKGTYFDIVREIKTDSCYYYLCFEDTEESEVTHWIKSILLSEKQSTHSNTNSTFLHSIFFPKWNLMSKKFSLNTIAPFLQKTHLFSILKLVAIKGFLNLPFLPPDFH